MDNKTSDIASYSKDFAILHDMIKQAQSRVWAQVNETLIRLYWNIGEFISKKAKNSEWGKSIVEQFAEYLSANEPSPKGFSARNIWRMKQFYETYQEYPKLSAVLTEITWSNHLHILTKTKSLDEKEYYLCLAAKNRYSEREFARLIDTSTFERTRLADIKLSALLTEIPALQGQFKDSYIFEFLSLPDDHKEHDLRKALLINLKKFLIELGTDFSLVGEEYLLQVGKKDFRVDLLLFHRGLNCMVAIELKAVEFEPSHLGQLQFYLEALDQNIKKPHENPTMGILICKTKDEEVVKFALNRNMSPTMIAEYETKLINKAILQQKLKEISEIL